MNADRYTPVGNLHACADCTARAVYDCTFSPANPRGHEVRGFCPHDHRVLVVDPGTHERFHVERAAAADAAQGSLL